jgi:hypothetical protein
VIDYQIPTLPHTIDGRACMRSVADACEALRKEHRLSDDISAQVRTIEFNLPTGIRTSIVLAVSQMHEDEPSWGVALPSSATFKGRSLSGRQQEFDISRLDGACVDATNRVTLVDGTVLYAVEVIPTRICRELNALQKRIVHLTIAYIGAEEVCYRALPDGLLPGQRFLDYSTLYDLELPCLKAIERYIAKRGLNVNRQTTANALSVCGMRRPRSGPLAVQEHVLRVLALLGFVSCTSKRTISPGV